MLLTPKRMSLVLSKFLKNITTLRNTNNPMVEIIDADILVRTAFYPKPSIKVANKPSFELL